MKKLFTSRSSAARWAGWLMTWTVTIIVLALLPACSRIRFPTSKPTAGPTRAAPTSAPTAKPKGTKTPGGAVATPTARTTVTGRSASVTDLQGQVEVRKSSTAPFAAATLGQVLQVGASLRTGDRGQATLQLIEGSIIRVTENTAFELTDLSGNQNNPKTVLGLDFGTLFVFAAKALGLSQFDIQTPSGVASVRGSYFSVKYSQGTIIVTCLESSAPCDFSTLGNSVTLRNGDKAVIDNLKFVLRVERMSQEDLSDFLTALPQAATILRTAFPSGTPTAGSTSTPTPTPTVFPSDTPTFGPVLIPVSTFTPTPTSTPTPTPTATCVPGVTVPCP